MDSEQRFNAVAFIILSELDMEENDLENLFFHDNVYSAAEMLHNEKNEFMFGIDGWEFASGLESLTMTPKMHLTALMVANELFPDSF